MANGILCLEQGLEWTLRRVPIAATPVAPKGYPRSAGSFNSLARFGKEHSPGEMPFRGNAGNIRLQRSLA
jgi:hypothetical protein